MADSDNVTILATPVGAGLSGFRFQGMPYSVKRGWVDRQLESGMVSHFSESRIFNGAFTEKRLKLSLSIFPKVDHFFLAM